MEPFQLFTRSTEHNFSICALCTYMRAKTITCIVLLYCPFGGTFFFSFFFPQDLRMYLRVNALWLLHITRITVCGLGDFASMPIVLVMCTLIMFCVFSEVL